MTKKYKLELSSDLFQQTLINLVKEFDKALDSCSENITNLEDALNKAGFYFPFVGDPIQIDEPSFPESINEDSKNIYGADARATQVRWYLAWDLGNEKSKKYRLLLISEEQTFILFDRGDNFARRLYESKILFRRPLIEVKLQNRLSYIKYLGQFINDLLKHYTQFIDALENNTNPITQAIKFISKK